MFVNQKLVPSEDPLHERLDDLLPRGEQLERREIG